MRVRYILGIVSAIVAITGGVFLINGQHSTATTTQLGARSPLITKVTIPASTPENHLPTFEPQKIKVVIGLNNTVQWVNQDNAPTFVFADNFTDPDFRAAANFPSTLDSKVPNVMQPGGSFEYTFTHVGTFGFHAKPWQAGMVEVLPPVSVR